MADARAPTDPRTPPGPRGSTREFGWWGGALGFGYEVGVRIRTLVDAEVEAAGSPLLPPGAGAAPRRREVTAGSVDEGIDRWESEGGR